MKIRVQTKLRPINIKPIDFDNIMWYIVDQSAKVFIEEVSLRVPLWTGQAVGTLLPAARILKYAKINLAIFRNGPFATTNKNVNTGSSHGQASRYKAGGSYHFNYSSSLNYMFENEYTDQASTPGQQRARAWKILEEVRPIVQANINTLVTREFKSVFSKIFVR